MRVRERVRERVRVRGRARGRLGARAHHAADGLRPVHGEIQGRYRGDIREMHHAAYGLRPVHAPARLKGRVDATPQRVAVKGCVRRPAADEVRRVEHGDVRQVELPVGRPEVTVLDRLAADRLRVRAVAVAARVGLEPLGGAVVELRPVPPLALDDRARKLLRTQLVASGKRLRESHPLVAREAVAHEDDVLTRRLHAVGGAPRVVVARQVRDCARHASRWRHCSSPRGSQLECQQGALSLGRRRTSRQFRPPLGQITWAIKLGDLLENGTGRFLAGFSPFGARVSCKCALRKHLGTCSHVRRGRGAT